MPANLENSAVATGLEKVSFHSNPKERQCQRMLKLPHNWASLVAQRLKRLPPMWETRVQFTVWEDSLEKEMVTHSSILAWRVPWTEKPGRLQSTGLQESDTTERLQLPHASKVMLKVLQARLQLSK